jgi:hypothetical protein
LKMGHYATSCKSPKATASATSTSSASMGQLTIASAHNPEKLDLVEVEVENINGRREKAKFLPDTGANITAFQPEILPQLGMSVDNLRMVSTVPKSADGSNLKTLGAVDVRLSKSGHTTEFITAYVIKNLQQPILSRQVLRELGMIPKNFPFTQLSIGNGAEFGDELIEKLEAALRQARAERGKRVSAATFPRVELGQGPDLDKIANEFPQVFDNTKIPTMAGGYYVIDLEDGAVPFNKGSSRTVPEPCMDKLKAELELQLSMGLIETVPAGEKSNWLHPIVVTPKKDGSIRLCVDLRMLNKFFKRPENPQRSPWEVVRTILTGCQHFATFNAFKGYHQVELDPESRKLTTFHTPFGRYRYVRLAMGLSSAGDVFTTRYGDAVNYTIEGRRCTEDTLLHGHTSDELARKTREFIAAFSEAGITLNVKKIIYDKPEVVFGGYLINENGYAINPALSTALSEFPVPK